MKWLRLTGQSIEGMERIKTNVRSKDSRTLGKPDERCNSLHSGRTVRNWTEVYRKHKWMQIMVSHSISASELWKKLNWKKFQKNLFRLQKRVFKAVQVGDKRKARSLQKLILKSKSARLLAIRQVTQLNAGKKTAGIDGKKSLNFEERLALSDLISQNYSNWKHLGLRIITMSSAYRTDGSDILPFLSFDL